MTNTSPPMPAAIEAGPNAPAPGATTRDMPAGEQRRANFRLRTVLLVGLLLAVLATGSVVGYRWWYDGSHFVTTDNAHVAGRLVQIGGLTAGRIVTVRYDVGDRVGRDEVVASLRVPVPVGTTSGGVPRLEYRETSDSLFDVRSPVTGVVVARGANPGDTVPAGQPVLTIVDPSALWVTANIEETQVRRLRLGQPVMVTVDALNRELEGRLVAITPASASTFSLLPAQNASGNFTKVTQLVPVKIAFEAPPPDLMIGTSASVKIETDG